MAQNLPVHRLSAILIADVAGYTRLVEEDTQATVDAWKAARDSVVNPTIASHEGRIVKHTGDGFLVEFTTVLAAVNCAVSLQRDLLDSTLDFRIGVSLGDIIDDGNDIHGEGVNIAARIEALSDKGGICISGGVFDQIKNRVDYQLEPMGEHIVRHVSAPVSVYKILMNEGIQNNDAPTVGDSVTMDKPSIAVLPFENMSSDQEQEYFADGITEDVITELSRFNRLEVTARNTTFIYKGQSVNIQKVGAELKVDYVVEGSVRKAGNNVRITVQLIDVKSGNHVWAERYDRQLEDIFEVQDDVVRAIAAILPGRITDAQIIHKKRRSTENLSAFDWLLKGNYAASKEIQDLDSAVSAYQKAIELDANCSAAYIGIAMAESTKLWSALYDMYEPSKLGLESALKAVEIDNTDYLAYGVLGGVYFDRGEQQLALKNIERAKSLNPNSTQVMGFWALYHAYHGDLKGSIDVFTKAVELDPFNVDSLEADCLPEAYFMNEQYDKALAVLQSMSKQDEPYVLAQMAMCCAKMGNQSGVDKYMSLFRKNAPEGIDVVKLCKIHMRVCSREKDAKHWTEAYRMIGFDI